MKVVTFLAATLFFANAAFGAIEFSEDQVAASASNTMAMAAPAATSAGRTAASGVIMAGASTPSAVMAVAPSPAVAAMVRSQATGTVGSSSGVNGMGGGGGAAASTGGVCDCDKATASPATVLGATTGAPSSNGTDPNCTLANAGGGAAAVSMPEPSMMVVWSVLGLLGLAVMRRRK